MTQEEKNCKLAEWAGFRYDYLGWPYIRKGWLDPNRFRRAPPSNFFTDLNAIFKWLVPLLEPIDIHFKRHSSCPEHINEVNCWLYFKGKKYEGWSKNHPAIAPAEALAEAIYKLMEAK